MSSSCITHIRRDLKLDTMFCSHFLFLLLHSPQHNLHLYSYFKQLLCPETDRSSSLHLMCSLRPDPSMVLAPHRCSCSDTSFWNTKTSRVWTRNGPSSSTATHTHTHPGEVHGTSKSGSVSQSSPSEATFMFTLWPTTDFHIWRRWNSVIQSQTGWQTPQNTFMCSYWTCLGTKVICDCWLGD